MAKGGYRVLDLKGANLGSQGVTIPGIYNFIEGTVGKPILVTNFKLDGVEQNSAFVCLKSVVGQYQGLWAAQVDGRMYVFRVTDSDRITATITSTPGPAAGDEQVSGEDGPSTSM